jgi:hypothetical protein
MSEVRFNSLENKFLIVRPSVVLTRHINRVIFELDAYFAAAGLEAYVTSGLRDANSQLKIIRNALTKRGLAEAYPEAFEDINKKIVWNGKSVFSWQPGWSKLLNIGYVVNPPFPAEVLMNYYRPGSKVNSKGMTIQSSPHYRGTAFDIGGSSNGVNDELEVIQGAKVEGLKDYLVERTNNAIHVDCFILESYAELT